MGLVELVEGRWLLEHLTDEGLIVVDPRPPIEYFRGHIYGSVNVRADRLLETLKATGPVGAARMLGEKGVSREGSVVVYDDEDGQLACTLAWILEYLGHGRVFILNQKLESWLAEHGHRALRPSPRSPTTFEATPRLEIRATLREVLGALGRATLLDVRSREEFTGVTRSGPRSGRIPGAINLPWLELVDQGVRLFPAPHEMRERLGGLLQAKRPIITYCSTGMRACVAYFALRWAGLGDVKVYDGSFEEWATQPGLPVEP